MWYNLFGDIMQIEKIKKLNSGKYKIVFGNNEKIITYDDVILKNGLLFNKEVSSSKFNDINIDTKYYDIYYKVIRFISKRLRSKKEIINFLDKNDVIKEDKDKIIDKLEYIGLLDDVNFVKAYVSDRINLSNVGPYRIKNELLEHDIDIDVIEKQISKIDSCLIEEKLDKYINKKVSLNHKNSIYVLKQKLYQELINLGYDSCMVKDKLDNIKGNSSVIFNEYNKLYNKLSKKYSGNDLYMQIKKKLYSKGFSQGEIDDCFRENE